MSTTTPAPAKTVSTPAEPVKVTVTPVVTTSAAKQ